MISRQIIWCFKAYINFCHFLQLNPIHMNSQNHLVIDKQKKMRFHSQIWLFSVTIQIIISIFGVFYAFEDLLDTDQKFVAQLASCCSALIQCCVVILTIHWMRHQKLILVCRLLNQTIKLDSKLNGALKKSKFDKCMSLNFV